MKLVFLAIVFFTTAISVCVTAFEFENYDTGSELRLPKFNEDDRGGGGGGWTKPSKSAPLPTTSSTTLPPTTRHPDDITIELCLQSMVACPLDAEKLIALIIRRRGVDKTAVFSGQGKSTGPVVNPKKIIDEVDLVPPKTGRGVGGTGGGGTGGGGRHRVGGHGGSNKGPVAPTTKSSIAERLERGRPGGYGVPPVCIPFGEKLKATRQYRINCVMYLYDRTIVHYYRRHLAMHGCLNCRKLCELGGAVRYL